MTKSIENQEKAFWANIKIGAADDCWPWQGWIDARVMEGEHQRHLLIGLQKDQSREIYSFVTRVTTLPVVTLTICFYGHIRTIWTT